MFAEGLRVPDSNNRWQQQHPRSAPLDCTRHSPGRYVYVVDASETVFVAPDGPHRHPEVLGNGEAALYAGELTIDGQRRVTELNNLSGTFRFATDTGLLCVAAAVKKLGFSFREDSISLYDANSLSRPLSLEG